MSWAQGPLMRALEPPGLCGQLPNCMCLPEGPSVGGGGFSPGLESPGSGAISPDQGRLLRAGQGMALLEFPSGYQGSTGKTGHEPLGGGHVSEGR